MGFEPTVRENRTLDFESSSFDHSDTSPLVAAESRSHGSASTGATDCTQMLAQIASIKLFVAESVPRTKHGETACAYCSSFCSLGWSAPVRRRPLCSSRFLKPASYVLSHVTVRRLTSSDQMALLVLSTISQRRSPTNLASRWLLIPCKASPRFCHLCYPAKRISLPRDCR